MGVNQGSVGEKLDIFGRVIVLSVAFMTILHFAEQLELLTINSGNVSHLVVAMVVAVIWTMSYLALLHFSPDLSSIRGNDQENIFFFYLTFAPNVLAAGLTSMFGLISFPMEGNLFWLFLVMPVLFIVLLSFIFDDKKS